MKIQYTSFVIVILSTNCKSKFHDLFFRFQTEVAVKIISLCPCVFFSLLPLIEKLPQVINCTPHHTLFSCLQPENYF